MVNQRVFSLVLLILIVGTLLFSTLLVYNNIYLNDLVTGKASSGSVLACINNQPSLEFNCSTELIDGIYYSCQLNSSDVNNDQLFFYQNTTAGNLVFNLSQTTGLISVTPDQSNLGQHNVTFTVVDERNCTNSINKINVTFEVKSNDIIYATYPEGFYYIKPSPLPAAGNYKYNFTIPFEHINGTTGDVVGCYINESNCYDDELLGCKQIFVNKTLTSNITDGQVNISYILNSNDIINSTGNGTSDNWIPWRIVECGHYNASLSPKVVNDSVNWFIHTRPIAWTIGDIANTVNAKSAEDMFSQNTVSANKDGDVAFAVSKYGGSNVELFCHDNSDNPSEPDVLSDDADPDCWGLTYSNRQDLHSSFTSPTTWYSPSGSHGTLAINIPSGDISESQTNFSSTFGETKIEYTMHTMPNGTFKIHFHHWDLSKTATIFAEGFPEIKNVTKIFPAANSSNGEIVYFLDKDNIPVDQDTLNESETHKHKFILRSYQSGGTEVENVDTTILIYFNESNVTMSEGYIIELTINYLEGLVSYEEKQNITIYFDDPTYNVTNNDSRPRWNSSNNNEWETRLDDPSMTWGACNDTKNGDFDYLNCAGTEEYCFQFQSYDCYDIDCNTKPGPPAHDDYYTNADTTGICGYSTEHLTDATCFDGYNNDWATEDDIWGHANSNLQMIDCRDSDCDTIYNPSHLIDQCQYLIELNCTDGFDNDYWQEKDCDGSKTGSYFDAEYDCAVHCRSTIDNNELGSECDDGIDNDWDLWATNVGGQNGYSRNTLIGAGIDCHWTAKFGFSVSSYPFSTYATPSSFVGEFADEDCDNETMGNGKRCELDRELNCYDEFDNDYDNEASNMYHAGWSNNPSLYFSLFNKTFSNDADFDDYDCALKPQVPSTEAVNDSWCFDSIDNDLDDYFWNGAGYSANTTGGGKDCYDYDCMGIVNPSNSYDVCLDKEFDPTNSYFATLPRIDLFCKNNKDDDVDGPRDCHDPDCYQNFDNASYFGVPTPLSNGICYACPSIELNTWDACANNFDNDYDGSTDEADSDCIDQLATYDNNWYVQIENDAFLCSNGYDDDQDGKTDCQDPNCNGFNSCGAEICNDDIDNDGDGLIDCMDSNCSSLPLCQISTDMSGTYSPPTTSTAIFDDLTVTWDKRVRINDPFTVVMNYANYDSTAYIWLGNLLDDGFSVGQGLQAESFSLSGSTSANFETKSYSNSTDETKGQISLMDAVNGSGASSIAMTLSIPTNDTLTNDHFELYHSIEVPSTGNIIDLTILDDIKPVINNVITEPSANSISLNYGSGIWFAVDASDEEHGDYEDGTIDRCFYSVTGPNSYATSGDDSSDCKFSIGNMISSGPYDFTIWARDDTGNYADESHIYKTVNILPIYKSGSFGLSQHFFNSTEYIMISSKFFSDEANLIATCALYYQAVNGSVVLASNFPTTYSGDLLTCEGNISTTVLSDNAYGFWTGIVDPDGDAVNSTKETVFVCNDSSSAGVGTYGELWNCTYDPDYLAEECGFSEPPIVNLTNPLNDSKKITSNITFNCDVSSTNTLYSVNLHVWNSSDSNPSTNTVINQSIYLSGATSYSAEYNVTLPYGSYEWNCEGVDTDFISGWQETNNTLDIDDFQLEVNLDTPSNGTQSPSTNVTFIYYVADQVADNYTCTLFISQNNNSLQSTGLSQTIFRNTSANDNLTFGNFTTTLANGVYDWNVNCTDGTRSSFADFNSTLTVNTSLGANQDPIYYRTIQDLSWQLSQTLRGIYLDDYFFDPDGDDLSYSAVFSSSNFQITFFPNSEVELSATSCGTGTVIFTATDTAGNSADSNLVGVNVPCSGSGSGSGSSGGSGSGSSSYTCISSWSCDSWSRCYENNTQERLCIDVHGCTDDWTFYQDCVYVAQCENGYKDINEEGVDCGGPCDACETCSDNLLNNLESEIDCGGPFCAPCQNCFDGIKNYGEDGVDCGGFCENECPIPPMNDATDIFEIDSRWVVLSLILLLLLLTSIVLCNRYKLFCASLRARLIWFFLGNKKKFILLTDPQKKQLLGDITRLNLPTNPSSLSVDDAEVVQHKLSLIFSKCIEFIFSSSPSSLEHTEENISKLPISKKVASALSHLFTSQSNLGSDSLKPKEEIYLSTELLRNLIFSISNSTKEDVARSINEYSVPDSLITSPSIMNINKVLYNAILALQFEEIAIAKKKYLLALKAYDSLSEDEKETVYPSLKFVFDQITYVSTFEKEKDFS